MSLQPVAYSKGDSASSCSRCEPQHTGGRLTRNAVAYVLLLSYKALAGHCSRVLRLEALLLVGAHLAPVAAASHVCEEADMHEVGVGYFTAAASSCKYGTA